MSSSQESSTPKKNTPKKNTPKKVANKGTKRAGKGTKKVSSGDKKTRKSSRKSNSYKSYIFKVLRKIAPKKGDDSFGISKNAMFVVDSMLMGLLRDIVKTSADLTTVSKRKTISSREIRTSTLLITENAKDRKNKKNIQSAAVGRLDSAIKTFNASHGESE